MDSIHQFLRYLITLFQLLRTYELSTNMGWCLIKHRANHTFYVSSISNAGEKCLSLSENLTYQPDSVFHANYSLTP